jgi:hypothetical protein
MPKKEKNFFVVARSARSKKSEERWRRAQNVEAKACPSLASAHSEYIYVLTIYSKVHQNSQWKPEELLWKRPAKEDVAAPPADAPGEWEGHPPRRIATSSQEPPSVSQRGEEQQTRNGTKRVHKKLRTWGSLLIPYAKLKDGDALNEFPVLSRLIREGTSSWWPFSRR